MIGIRPAREDDAQLVAEIGMRAWRRAIEAIGETEAMAKAARDAFDVFAADGWRTITVVEDAGQIVGWAARQTQDATISDFWIEPGFFRQGYGSLLLHRIEADIAAQGFDSALIDTHSGNERAIAFFKKHGYAIHALTVAYNPALDRDVPTVSLSKNLAGSESDLYTGNG
ncbi:GNAT family N-acetyltransferase [Oryzifoliimicrobium ureilyticus]|uniref:GNAT family N-acetyltransferase n=1 Tax=Oryzifoliimicrobium ureilyticus TaxID=3113724 RepID=UPI0030765104